MSGKLAIASVFSVFLMVSYVLLGGDARHLDLRAQASLLPQIEAPAAQPQAGALLPR